MSTIHLTYSPYRSMYRSAAAKNRSSRVGRQLGQKTSGLSKISLKNFKIQFSPALLIVALMTVIGFLFVAYLTQFNQVSTKGYDLKKLEKDRQQLMDQNDISTMHLAKARSLNSIQNSEKIGRMVKARSIEFVRGDTVLASADSGS